MLKQFAQLVTQETIREIGGSSGDEVAPLVAGLWTRSCLFRNRRLTGSKLALLQRAGVMVSPHPHTVKLAVVRLPVTTRQTTKPFRATRIAPQRHLQVVAATSVISNVTIRQAEIVLLCPLLDNQLTVSDTSVTSHDRSAVPGGTH